MSEEENNTKDPWTFQTVVAGISLFITILFVRAVILIDFWEWFAVPLGAVPISSLWHALGVATLVSLLVVKIDWNKQSNPTIARMGGSVFVYLLLWAVGWFYQVMM